MIPHHSNQPMVSGTCSQLEEMRRRDKEFMREFLAPPAYTNSSKSACSYSSLMGEHIEYLYQRERHLALHPFPPPLPLHSSPTLLHNHMEYLLRRELHLLRHPYFLNLVQRKGLSFPLSLTMVVRGGACFTAGSEVP